MGERHHQQHGIDPAHRPAPPASGWPAPAHTRRCFPAVLGVFFPLFTMSCRDRSAPHLIPGAPHQPAGRRGGPQNDVHTAAGSVRSLSTALSPASVLAAGDTKVTKEESVPVPLEFTAQSGSRQGKRAVTAKGGLREGACRPRAHRKRAGPVGMGGSWWRPLGAEQGLPGTGGGRGIQAAQRSEVCGTVMNLNRAGGDPQCEWGSGSGDVRKPTSRTGLWKAAMLNATPPTPGRKPGLPRMVAGIRLHSEQNGFIAIGFTYCPTHSSSAVQ